MGYGSGDVQPGRGRSNEGEPRRFAGRVCSVGSTSGPGVERGTRRRAVRSRPQAATGAAPPRRRFIFRGRGRTRATRNDDLGQRPGVQRRFGRAQGRPPAASRVGRRPERRDALALFVQRHAERPRSAGGPDGFRRRRSGAMVIGWYTEVDTSLGDGQASRVGRDAEVGQHDRVAVVDHAVGRLTSRWVLIPAR